jgi:hypothetical protein
MGAPNLQTSMNPDVVTGGDDFGSIIGRSPSETVGFYGETGVAQQSSVGITTVAQVVAALVALGILSA